METTSDREMTMYLKGRFEGIEVSHHDMKEQLNAIELKLDEMGTKIEQHRRWFTWIHRVLAFVGTLVVGTLTIDWRKLIEAIRGVL